uniref:DNA mismatch repair proteins mutS family domain-containing protein n=2 Tax=Timema TaxID=61471 RepID=A0A7R9EZS1_9NEOP|nr:unnamed protein product [Timema bartmani]
MNVVRNDSSNRNNFVWLRGRGRGGARFQARHLPPLLSVSVRRNTSLITPAQPRSSSSSANPHTTICTGSANCPTTSCSASARHPTTHGSGSTYHPTTAGPDSTIINRPTTSSSASARHPTANGSGRATRCLFGSSSANCRTISSSVSANPRIPYGSGNTNTGTSAARRRALLQRSITSNSSGPKGRTTSSDMRTPKSVSSYMSNDPHCVVGALKFCAPYEDFVNWDENLAVCNELRNAETLADVKNINDSASSDEEREKTGTSEKPIPTSTQAMDHTEELRWFFEGQHNVNPSIFQALDKLEEVTPNQTMCEGRGHARGEVGLAAIDTRHPHLILCQISDSQSYINTLTKINVFNPVEWQQYVATASRLELVRSLQGSGSQNSLLGILNHCSTAGGTRLLRANILQPPCLPEIIRNRLDSVQEMVDHPEMFAALQLMLSKFTNVEQLLCLCMHIPQQDNTRVAEFQLKYILLLKNILELLPGLKTVLKDAHSNCLRSAREDSYSKMIAHNICALGGEYVSYCYFRQDLCSKMITHNICALGGENVSYSRQDSCSKMIAPNICALGGEYVSYCYSRQDLCSKMIAHNICALGGEYVRYCYSRQDLCSKMIAHNICALGDYYYDLFQALSDSRFAKILERILQTLNNDARHEKNFTASHMQRNFAVKTNINGLLDVARKTYSLVSQLAEETNLPLEVGFTTARGFHIQMSLGNKRAFHDLNLPDKFIQVQRSRNNYTFTTQELVILDQRGKEILQEVQSISSVVIFGLLTDIRGQIGCLYKLTENILQLDMLVSFAHVSSINNYTRPQFSTELDVKQARHPILDFISHTTPKSNDAFASSSYNFHIITGPNMSGKSIYMRQIAMLQIMAQGHRESKSLPSQSLHDSKNLPYQGLQENRKLSSKKAKAYCSRGFKRVREMHYIKQALTPTSLVIMDELCRGTSVEDGTALTWALCEELLHTTAFFFLATHFLFVTKLQDLYYNVINHHFEVKEEETEKGRGRLVYTHCLKPGVTQVAHYGLRLAENLAMPASIVESARTVVEEILQHRKVRAAFIINTG